MNRFSIGFRRRFAIRVDLKLRDIGDRPKMPRSWSTNSALSCVTLFSRVSGISILKRFTRVTGIVIQS
jgi:hypothetical protein